MTPEQTDLLVHALADSTRRDIVGKHVTIADVARNPDDALPTTQFTVTLAELPSGGTRMLIETRLPSEEAMEQLVEMGMEEGLAAAMGQIDGILAAAQGRSAPRCDPPREP